MYITRTHTPGQVDAFHQVCANKLPDHAENQVWVASEQVLVPNVNHLATQGLGA